MYFGVGNPAPFPGVRGAPWGSSRPGRNLYTDSIVKLDTRTGKLDWYFQLTPHDIYGWDLQGPPILMSVGGRELVVAAGKSGIVIALDAKSGKLAWKRPVGTHNGHDDDGLLAMRGQTGKLKPPFEIYPGSVGGVIAPMSTNGSSVFVPVVNHPLRVSSGWQTTEASSVNKGELVSLDAGTGRIEWKYEFPAAPAFGATSSVNDVVFITTLDGMVSALDERNGELLWEAKLPAGTNTGVSVADDTVIAPAGYTAEGGTAGIVAYRLDG
jgi:glucose dehydrogenase